MLTYAIRQRPDNWKYYGAAYHDALPAHYTTKDEDTIEQVKMHFPIVEWEDPQEDDDRDIVAIFVCDDQGNPLR